MPEAVTRGIHVRVESEYVEHQSNPKERYYFFAYHVTLINEGTQAVRLLSRHWIITDANGNTREVRGPGVVGQQPTLQPGESFRYSSACPLPTAIGSMTGTYQMTTLDGERFNAQIPTFTLAEPYAFN